MKESTSSYLSSMEVKLDIPFEQLLRIIRQLSPAQRKKVQAVLENGVQGNSHSVDQLDEILLNGPTFSKAQLMRMAETRKAFDQWRKKWSWSTLRC